MSGVEVTVLFISIYQHAYVHCSCMLCASILHVFSGLGEEWMDMLHVGCLVRVVPIGLMVQAVCLLGECLIKLGAASCVCTCYHSVYTSKDL